MSFKSLAAVFLGAAVLLLAIASSRRRNRQKRGDAEPTRKAGHPSTDGVVKMSEEKMQMEREEFVGTLFKDGEELHLNFSVLVDASGEAQISLAPLKRDASTKFVVNAFHGGNERFAEFSLKGMAKDGTIFSCDNLIFTSLGNDFNHPRSMSPTLGYSLARVRRNTSGVSFPVMEWMLKNFRTFHRLSKITDLGLVEMHGAREASQGNAITGFIRITATCVPDNLAEWKSRADSLCSHLQSVMSFAQNVDLSFPIISFYSEKTVEAELYHRGAPLFGVWPPFQSLHLNDIFDCAIKSFFSPPVNVINLPFAIKWFNINSPYVEANLISAMTVLENLLDSNLLESDTLLMNEKQYQKIRKKLSAVVKDEVIDWVQDADEQKSLVSELNGRFRDLQRRSLLDKLKTLAAQWGVPLDDIEDGYIKSEKTARDHVVHRGHYDLKISAGRDLHDHFLITREIVTRFILAALGFEGRYESFVGGQHSQEFRRKTVYEAGRNSAGNS